MNRASYAVSALRVSIACPRGPCVSRMADRASDIYCLHPYQSHAYVTSRQCWLVKEERKKERKKTLQESDLLSIRRSPPLHGIAPCNHAGVAPAQTVRKCKHFSSALVRATMGSVLFGCWRALFALANCKRLRRLCRGHWRLMQGAYLASLGANPNAKKILCKKDGE